MTSQNLKRAIFKKKKNKNKKKSNLKASFKAQFWVGTTF
jgi:hypothetical protein